MDNIGVDVLGSEVTLLEVLTKLGAANIRAPLETLYTDTGISYFRPNALLVDGAMDEVFHVGHRLRTT